MQNVTISLHGKHKASIDGKCFFYKQKNRIKQNVGGQKPINLHEA